MGVGDWKKKQKEKPILRNLKSAQLTICLVIIVLIYASESIVPGVKGNNFSKPKENSKC